VTRPCKRLFCVSLNMEITLKFVLFCFFVALLWTNGLAAQVCNAPTGGAPTISKQGIGVPITIRGGGVFIPVVMNDGHTYSFLLDSGFEDSVLDPSTVRALHLKSEEEHTEAGPGVR
jgi:hypothetical protein